MKPQAQKSLLEKYEPVLADDQPVDTAAFATARDRLILFLETTLLGFGYELVAYEIIHQRQKVLRLFIDKIEGVTNPTADSGGITTPTADSGGITIEDCVRATHLLDTPLETNLDIAVVFEGAAYELEVSSPGIERPLWKPSDFKRFTAQIARIHTHRPLMESDVPAEMNADRDRAVAYLKKNPKQKNFFGILRGWEDNAVWFGVVPEDGTLKPKKGQKAPSTELPLKNETRIRIPVDAIAKANLEPPVRGL